jgi:hypothetical protein
MPLHKISSEELRTACRQKLETCETWLRRLIHETFSNSFGSSYFYSGIFNGNNLFRSDIRDHAGRRMREQPARYSREIDTLLLDHLVATLCKQDLYSEYFQTALRRAFPNGNAEARTFLGRLVSIRNALSHANPISVHEAERALCYCDDVIWSLKEFYREQNMAQEYNTPRFIRFSDSLGHTEYPLNTQSEYDYRKHTSLRPGEPIRLEVEVDDSFPPEEYTIEWVVSNIPNGESALGTSFVLEIQRRHVAERFYIVATLKSKEDWHRYLTFDDRLIISYKILPPIS